MRLALADTGPLYALTDPADRHHRRALAELVQLTGVGRVLAAPFPVLCESYSLILYHLGPEAAIRWWRKSAGGGLGMLNPTRKDYLEAASWISRYQDQTISLFDGLLAVLSRRVSAPVWTFDHQFDLMHVQVWRSA